jgi:hypothetical protein
MTIMPTSVIDGNALVSAKRHFLRLLRRGMVRVRPIRAGQAATPQARRAYMLCLFRRTHHIPLSAGVDVQGR